MATKDFSKPYTVEEREELKQIFRSSPTYNKDDETISSCDLNDVVEKMGYERTEEQISEYKAYWDKHYSGVIPMTKFIDACATIYDVSKSSKFAAAVYDKNGDGFISMDEFEEFVHLMVVHEPKLQEANFDKFVQEADTNKDGKVSVEEFAVWIENFLKQK